MAWTEITRPKYQRGYASDTADAEWEMIEPHLPPPAKCGRTREAASREVIATLGGPGPERRDQTFPYPP
jgi:hypothetical protein